MARFGLRGTPSTLVIDPAGLLRFHAFGAVDDLALGATIGSLLSARRPAEPPAPPQPTPDAPCDPEGCHP